MSALEQKDEVAAKMDGIKSLAVQVGDPFHTVKVMLFSAAGWGY